MRRWAPYAALALVVGILIAISIAPAPQPHPPVGGSGAPLQRPSAALAASDGAPAPQSYASPGSCPQVIGTSGGSTTALVSWIESFPSGSTIVFPFDACYVTNGLFELGDPPNQLNDITIDGNGATFTQTIPGLDGGTDESECPTGSRLYLLASSNDTIENLNFQGAWDGVNPANPPVTKTAQSGTAAGSLVFNNVNNIVVGNLVNGPGLTADYYVTAVNTSTDTVTYKDEGSGLGTPSSSSVYSFDSNGGVHCEAYNGIQLEGDSHLLLTGITLQDVQGDGLSVQTSNDPDLATDAVNQFITISNSNLNGTGYDCISMEGADHVTAVTDVFRNCALNAIDFELDLYSSGFLGPQCAYACQTNVTFTHDIFKNWGVDFYTSPQDQCPGVQQQRVTFSGNTLEEPSAGMFVRGTSSAVCQALVTTHSMATTATTITLANANVLNTELAPPVGLQVAGPGLTSNDWTVTAVNFTTNVVTIAGSAGAPSGGKYVFSQPTTTKYLTIYLTFANNTIKTTTRGVGFTPPYGGDPNCGEAGHPNCPSAYAMEFVNVNHVTMTNNVFPLFYETPTYGPYQAAIFNQNVNTETVDDNDFQGANALFFSPNLNSVGVTDCGNTWGANNQHSDKSCTAP